MGWLVYKPASATVEKVHRIYLEWGNWPVWNYFLNIKEICKHLVLAKIMPHIVNTLTKFLILWTNIITVNFTFNRKKLQNFAAHSVILISQYTTPLTWSWSVCAACMPGAWCCRWGCRGPAHAGCCEPWCRHPPGVSISQLYLALVSTIRSR